MSKDKGRSKTERDTTVVERFVTGGHHYKTTISDGRRRVEGRANTASESEERASKKWQKP